MVSDDGERGGGVKWTWLLLFLVAQSARDLPSALQLRAHQVPVEGSWEVAFRLGSGSWLHADLLTDGQRGHARIRGPAGTHRAVVRIAQGRFAVQGMTAEFVADQAGFIGLDTLGVAPEEALQLLLGTVPLGARFDGRGFELGVLLGTVDETGRPVRVVVGDWVWQRTDDRWQVVSPGISGEVVLRAFEARPIPERAFAIATHDNVVWMR